MYCIDLGPAPASDWEGGEGAHARMLCAHCPCGTDGLQCHLPLCQGATEVRTTNFQLPPATPVLTPAGGLLHSPEVAVHSAGAELMCYTIDGSEPACNRQAPPRCTNGAVAPGSHAIVPVPDAKVVLRVVGCSQGGTGWAASGGYLGIGAAGDTAASADADDAAPAAEAPEPTHVDGADAEPVIGAAEGSPEVDATCETPARDAQAQAPAKPQWPPDLEDDDFDAKPTVMSQRLQPLEVPRMQIRPGNGAMRVVLSAKDAEYICQTTTGRAPQCAPEGCAHGEQELDVFTMVVTSPRLLLQVCSVCVCVCVCVHVWCSDSRFRGASHGSPLAGPPPPLPQKGLTGRL